jgi:cyclase
MLTRRVIPAILIKDDWVVQSKGFGEFLPIGIPQIAVKYLSDWGADEILILDISATKSNKKPNFSLIESCATLSQVPLSIGGGVSNLEVAQNLFHIGVEKVAINHAASSELFSKIADKFGSQSIVLSLDVQNVDGKNMVFDHKRSKHTDLTVYEKLSSLDNSLFGEVLIQSVDRDGSESGYDIESLSEICQHTEKPIIALGGYGVPKDLEQLFRETNVSAAAIGNRFHHSEHSLIVAKSSLGIDLNIRLETNARYDGIKTDKLGRISKREEEYLNELLYKKIEKEEI